MILCRVKYFEKAVGYSERHARSGLAVCVFSSSSLLFFFPSRNVDPSLGPHNVWQRRKTEREADFKSAKEPQETKIKITNFQPFEIGILLRYIYHPSMPINS